MIGFIRRLLVDRKGNTLAIAAACLPLVVGAAGLATDTIQWTLWKRQLQRAADSAAMAGVYDRVANGGTTTATPAAVCHDISLNLHTWMNLNNTANCTGNAVGGYTTLQYDNDCTVTNAANMVNRVCTTLRVQQALPFSSIFMSSAPMITASATAASVPDGAIYCVLGTDPSSRVSGITISGSTTLDLGTCSLMADSSNPTQAASNGTSSANGGSGSTVTAASISAVGQINYSSNWHVGSYNPSATAVADPFASMVSAIPSTCTKSASLNGNNVTINRTTGTTPDTASDVVCLSGNQTIQGNVTLGPATYVIDGGNLGMNNNNASLSCDGCTIILTNSSNPASTGTVNLTGGSIDLKPPRSYATTGSDGNPRTVTIGNQSWAGIAIYQDPRATDGQNGNNAQNKIRGNSALSVQGAVYFGNQSLEFVGGGSDNAACLQVVAKRVTFSGNSRIQTTSACGAFGLNPIGGGRRIRLVA